MLIPVNYSQVNLIFSGTEVPRGAEVTFGVSNPTSQAPLAIASSVKTAFQAAGLQNFLKTTTQLATVRVKNGPNATGPMVDYTASVAGTGTDSTLTPNTAVLVRKTTTGGGRKQRGRLYWPGTSETAIDDQGMLTSAYRTSLQSAFTAFLGDLTTAGYDMVLLHGDGSTPSIVVSLDVQAQVATQRRRLRK